MEISYSASITDLIQSLGVLLGVPTAIWGIFKLFRKDKEKELQINAMQDIAKSQNLAIEKMKEQIAELAKQTAQFEYQSELFKESNELLKGQIEIQTRALVFNKENEILKLESEEKKRKRDIKPFFKRDGWIGEVTSLNMPLINMGGRAFFIGIEEINIENISIDINSKLKIIVEKKGIYNFLAYRQGAFDIRSLFFDVNLIFEDEDGNKYKQNLKGIGINAIIGNPIEFLDPAI